MSSSNKRRHSKWDNKDSEPLPETLYDRAQPRRPREPYSPGRASRRHDIRIKESALTLDREGNCPRISPELDEWRSRHSSRSPRNGWGRSHRISGSRSRSRSQSPVHNFRREPTVNDRSRSRSGVSAPICRDFAAGRCRRGNSCHFLHQDNQLYDSRRSLECGPLDDWENRRRRTGSSRYSPDDSKDNVTRTDKSAVICNDYLKGRCRKGDSCRFVHQDTTSDKGPVEDVIRNRDIEHRSRDTYPDHGRRSRDPFPDNDRRSRDPYPDHDDRSRDPYPDHDRRSRDLYPDLDHRRWDTYPDRNHESETPRRGETPCKFFAAGNCRNETRCRFSHQVKEAFSPERRQRDDTRDPGRKYEGGHGWDGPRWSDATTISTVHAMQGWEEDKTENKEVDTVRIQGDGRVPDHKYESDQVWDGPNWTDATTVPIVTEVHDWGEGKNEITEVAKDVTRARPEDDSWNYDMLAVKPTWETTGSIEKSQIQDKEEPVQWKTENIVPGMIHSASTGTEILSGDMDISPRDIKQQGIDPSISQMPSLSLSSMTFPAVQQGSAGEASYDKHYPTGFQDQKVFNDPFAEQNLSYKDIKPTSYSGDRRDVIGDDDESGIIENQPINVPQGQIFFQPDKSASIHPNINPPTGQSPLPVISIPPRGETILVSHNPPSFLDNKVAEGSHVVSLSSSSLAPVSSTSHSTVSNKQLAQLSHLTASLTQLLENRQQLSQFSAVTNLPNLAAPLPPVSGATIQPNQVPEVLKQYDPLCNTIEPKMPNLGNQLLPSVEQKNSDNELHQGSNNKIHHESGNMNQREPLASTKDEENDKETLEGGIKAQENVPSQDVGADDLAHDDTKKLKDTKGIRPFKFALAEFVKELLKPSWKDGQVSKDAYKTIVKKVVDKVMETLGPQIPHTKEKIDLYLSCSKQKIDKLVQAYLGKHQKS